MSSNEARGRHREREPRRFKHKTSDPTQKNAADGLDNEPIRASGPLHYLGCESAPVGYQLLDAGGYILYVNEEWCRIVGYLAESVIGHWFGEFLPPGQVDEFRKRLAAFKKKGVIREAEYIVVCDGGKRKNILFSARVEYDGNGEVMRIHCFLHDITDWASIETELKRSEERFRALIESIPLGIFLMDNNGQGEYSNKQLQEMFGLSNEECRGYGWAQIVHREDREELLKRIRRNAIDKKEFSTVFRVVTPGGELKWMNSRTVPLLSRTGERIGRIGTIKDITEWKTSHAQLEESERKFRRVFENSVIGIILMESNGVFRMVNDSICTVLGYSEEELLSRKLADIMQPDGMHMIESKISELLSGHRENFLMERRIIHRDGSAIWGIVGISTVRNDDGSHLLMMQFQNVTEQKKALEATVESEKKYRLVSENIPVAVYSALPDRDSTNFFISGRIEELTGYSGERFMSGPEMFNRIIHDEDREYVWKKISEHRKLKGPLDIEYRIRTKSGEIKWVRDKAKPQFDEQGNITKIDGFMEDITKKKLMEIALGESEQKYQSILDSVGFGIAVVNQHMEVILVNKQMLNWFPDIDVSKKPICYEVYNDPQKSEVCSYCPTRKTFDDGRIHEVVSRILSKGRIKNYRIVSSPLKNEKGEVIAVVESVQEITHSLKMEKELLKNEKLKTISILAGGLAHDFNNIMTSLMGNISLIKENAAIGEDISELIGEVELAAERANRLTRQLESFSVGRALFRESLGIAKIIRESAEFTLHGSSFSCEYDLPDDLAPVNVDVDQFDQVISNLILNAMQAMPAGGTIKIFGKNITIRDNSNLSLPAGKYVRILVEDSGVGIPDENLPHIFESFFTTKDGGSGLGLAHCLAIIKKHEGDIRVESRVGVGTKIHIYLPISKNKTSKDPASKDANKNMCYRILVLDDEEPMRRLMRRMLNSFGCEVECAADGFQVLNLYKEAMETGCPFDAVILDLTVRGGIGGKETLSKLLKIDPGVRGIAMSGYSSDPAIRDYEKYGFRAGLAKPFKIEELKEALRQSWDSDSKG